MTKKGYHFTRATKSAIVLSAVCLLYSTRVEAQVGPSILWSTAVGGNGHTYALTLARDTWTASEAAAVAAGGHLVSITSQAEQDFVVANFLTGAGATSPFWIGLTDQPNHDSRSYTNWTTGEAVTYANFFPGEPNNLKSDEDYVAINWHYSFGSSPTPGTWNDLPNGGSTDSFNATNARALGPYYGIAEFAQFVPEPGTNVALVLSAASGLVLLWRRGGAAKGASQGKR